MIRIKFNTLFAITMLAVFSLSGIAIYADVDSSIFERTISYGEICFESEVDDNPDCINHYSLSYLLLDTTETESELAPISFHYDANAFLTIRAPPSF